ncbi:Pentatricopeptide repeat-containing protein, mitochondrial [Zostera marina]|uniref:Pentatricopeptide repeat-containing protein, mitochondrial n=1 Tax=Zostera marina TaxID=29655 RepID=A0A0K9PU73_ZOSMR|nr:Pentatricopeptide repeat-containing protein, mitochondrial [Zostera marina]
MLLPFFSRSLRFSQRFLKHRKPPYFSKTLASNFRFFSDKDRPVEWTDEIEYLDEKGSVIDTCHGVRAVTPGHDDHFMAGSVKKSIPISTAAAKIAEIAHRWRWGPDLESHLDRLPFLPTSVHVDRALADISSSETCLAVFRWGRRQDWYTPSDSIICLLIDRLQTSGNLDSVQNILEHDLISAGFDFPVALNRGLRSLSSGGRLEVAFSCFKQVRDSGGGSVLESSTYNSLITLFLSKGLPYKAFEIHESMESVTSCFLQSATYDLMIPSLARSGRLDAAVKLYHELRHGKGENAPAKPSFQVYSSLVESLGKSGRLDQSLRMYDEMKEHGYRPSVAMYSSLIEAFVKAGKLDLGVGLWEEMRKCGFRPNFALFTMMVEAHAKSGKLDAANRLFGEMEKAGFLPTPVTYAALIEINSATGNVDASMRLYNSMINAGLKPGLTTYTSLLTLLSNKKLLDLSAKILLEMRSVGFPVDINASDVLMVYIKDGSTDLALRWLQFMGSAGLRTNNFIVRQLFESCIKQSKYDSAQPLLETYVGSASKVDLILYTSILARLVRCKDEEKERQLMGLLSTTKHKAHFFMCGLFTGPEQRKMPVLAFVREFFQSLDYEMEEGAARYFVNVLLNYLVLMGQLNRARCVWKVAYEAKLFPKAIVFDQHIAWSLDVRSLSVGAALVATVHTLHRFRKRMLYYGVVPRRIKLVTGSTLRLVVARALAAVESPFEVSKVVLRAPGDSVLEWFKKPIVQQFLLNDIPSKSDVLMHRLDVMFPSSTAERRSLSPVKSFAGSRNIQS